MAKSTRISSVSFVLLFSLIMCSAGILHAKSITIGQMKCEYLSNPEGIDVTNPRLSWKLESPERGQVQKAYRILVASSPTVLQQNKGDFWDSGRQDTDQTSQIAYSGKKLSSYDKCYWKLCVWDKDNKQSEWSDVQSFSIGILEKGGWKGKWIGHTREYTDKEKDIGKGWTQQSPCPIFRREFQVKKPVVSAYLYICGIGYHEIILNEGKVGNHVLDPAFTRYDRACLYVTHDITQQVRQGRNAIGIMLGNGWYNIHTKAAWNFNQAPWRARPKAIAQMRIVYSDGSEELIATDQSWKASTGAVLFDGLRKGEIYDARLEKSGWTKAGYDDSKWAKADIVEAPKGTLRAQMGHPIRITEVIKPVNLTEPKQDVFVYDLGQNIAGWARINVTGPMGTKIKLVYGERINSDGTVNQDQIKQHSRDSVFQTDTYILKGDGKELWHPRFTYHGFQYVQVTGFPGTPTIDNLDGLVVHTAFEKAGTFKCSNDLLNKIQDCTLWSYRGNFHGHPTDCPHREKNGWTGDAHLAAEQAMYNWDNAASYTKWMMDFHDEQKLSGELPGIVPTGGWGYAWGNGPAWDSAYIIIPWFMYRYYDDTSILETHFDRFKRYVDYLTTKADNNIVSIGLGDWVPAKTKTPEAVTSTAFYYADALLTGLSASILEKHQDTDKYLSLAKEIRKSFIEKFDKGSGIYANGSQTALSFASQMVGPPENKPIVDKLAENVKSQDYHIDTGILGAKWIFNVLSENGYHDVAYKMATQTTFPSYGNWINKGATTLWEDWPGAASLNHIMFGDISAWFYKYLAGIKLDTGSFGTNAFKTIIIKPMPVGDLTWARASVDSIHGRIGSDWKIKDKSITLTVQIPVNTSARVYVPSKSAQSVTESGNSIDAASGIMHLRDEDGYSVFTVLSGKYVFKSVME